MSIFWRIREEFEAAEREREHEAAKSEAAKSEAGGVATPAAPAAESARGSRSTTRNAGSPTIPPPLGNKRHRPIPKTDRKSTGAESISQNPSQVRSRDGEILIAVMGAAGSSRSYFCRTAAGIDGDGIGAGGRPGSRNGASTPLKCTSAN